MNLLPKRPPIPLIPSLLLTGIIIGFVASRTNIWIGLVLFVLVVILPVTYMTYVHYLGAVMAMRGELHDAIKHYGRVLKLPVNKGLVYMRRAALKNAVGDIDGAIEDYTAALHHLSSPDPAV